MPGAARLSLPVCLEQSSCPPETGRDRCLGGLDTFRASYHELHTTGRMGEGRASALPGMYNHRQSHRRGGDNTFPTNSVAYLPIRYLSNCRFIHKCRCGDEVSPARAVLQRYPYEVFGSGPGRPEVHLQGVPQHLALQRSCGDGAALLDISLYIDWSGRHRQPRQRWQTTFLNCFSELAYKERADELTEIGYWTVEAGPNPRGGVLGNLLC